MEISTRPKQPPQIGLIVLAYVAFSALGMPAGCQTQAANIELKPNILRRYYERNEQGRDGRIRSIGI